MQLRHVALMAGIVAGSLPGSSQAAYILNITQSGSDVLFSGSGSLNTSSLKSVESGDVTSAAINGGDDIVYIGTGSYVSYGYASGPSFGLNKDSFTSITTGSTVGLFGGFGHDNIEVTVPKNYKANDDLGMSTATFENATFQSLGLKSGTFTFSFGNRTGFDTFTVNVGPVPLPSTAPMFGVALLALGGLAYVAKRERAATA